MNGLRITTITQAERLEVKLLMLQDKRQRLQQSILSIRDRQATRLDKEIHELDSTLAMYYAGLSTPAGR